MVAFFAGAAGGAALAALTTEISISLTLATRFLGFAVEVLLEAEASSFF